ncbi:MAG: hypothetical protein JO002_15390 [Burkholderiaceae bacterium]|nr:hypothetical protein [Burkholderiaceae bacterium]
MASTANRLLLAPFAAALALAAGFAHADPDDSLLTTYSQYGVRQIDVEYGIQKVSHQFPADAAAFGVGLSMNDDWYSEFYLAYAHDGGNATVFDSAALENIFTLTGGTSPIDVGLFTEIEYQNDRSQGYKLAAGPLFRADFGLTTANLNLLFHRDYRADDYNPMQLDYQWQIKRRVSAALELGFQGFGTLGQWDHWAPQDQQEHRLGPVVLGRLALNDKRVIHYNAALLFDAFDRQHAATFRVQALIGF